MDGRPSHSGALAAIRPAIAALPESGILEVSNYGRDRPGLIPLWYGEGDLPTPGFIGEAAVAALRDGQTYYTHQRGVPALRQALADYLLRIYGAPVGADRITVTSGGMSAIALATQALIDPGDEVALVTPVWPNLAAAVAIMGGRVREVPLSSGNAGWRLDLDRLFAACGPRTRAIVVNSPTNPTGWILERPEMEALRDFARARGLWIVADEVYGRIVYDRPHAPSFLEVTEPDDRLIVVNTLSKNWSMTGWRVGWLVAPAELGRVFENLVQFNTSGTATFLQHAGAAAVAEGESAVAALVERCRQGRDLVCDGLARLPRVRLTRPDGAFYAFFAVEGEADSLALAKRLVDVANVGLAPGIAFGAGGEGHLRLCFAASEARLREAMDRLLPALA